MDQYIVATIKPWDIEVYKNRIAMFPGRWHLIEKAHDLSFDRLSEINPRFVFFTHWSELVPDEIVERFECVCFHMTDLPYGRGGSPLQNLIVRGHTDTVLASFRMTEELDAGSIYLKSQIPLSGRAQEIYDRVAELIFDMIEEIVIRKPEPTPQIGEPTFFKRRTPEQSVLPEHGDLKLLHDHIRMLDTKTYPKAFIDHGATRIEFTHASLEGGELTAKVKIKTLEKNNR